MTYACILTDQQDITKQRLAHVERPPIAEGQARLRLQNFALTANNVTYASTGFVIGYWQFFPSGIEGAGIVPVWGTAQVTESRAPHLPVGTRLYGFYPMAEELVLTPQADSAGVYLDQTPHRAELPQVYNTYVEVQTTNPEAEHLRALLQPLLATSYLLFDWLIDNACFGAQQIIIGSASSKTGLGLCKFLAEPVERRYRIIGLTSAANRGFVESLGACDHTLTYDQVEELEKIPSIYVDMAGNASVKSRLHHHLGENVKYSAAVGTSHWDQFAAPTDLPGAKPRFFFAPSQIAKRRADWGPGVIEGQITQAWKRIAADASTWLDLRAHCGLQAALPVYGDLARGDAQPRDGHVITLGD
ncbi:DUF2855 family protein [Pararhodobacter oceanensis]|uniref:DUF2855 family protein n=1 Tax=Pararhodobacter oceanensis TaxID=2172121 RepID=UPI003A9287F0